jgi:thiosulfate dehydrogenase
MEIAKLRGALKVASWCVLGAILVSVAVLGYLVSGYAPTSTSDHPLPLEKRIAELALRARIKREAPSRDVSRMSNAEMIAGAATYRKRCAMCHGLPNQPSPDIADAMFPKAPQFMILPQVIGSKPDTDFWKVKNGVRLTGMPSYQNLLSDDQIWQVVGLLAHRRMLPPEVKEALHSSVQASPMNETLRPK